MSIARNGTARWRKPSPPYHAVRLGFCMVRSLKQKDAEQLVDRRTYDRIAATRSEKTFTSIEDVWRRAGVPMAMLYHIAAADGFHGLGLSRRDAAWAIKGLRDEALPLFAAADDRAGLLRPEALEPRVTLAPMTQGREVVEDYQRAYDQVVHDVAIQGLPVRFAIDRAGPRRRRRRRPMPALST